MYLIFALGRAEIWPVDDLAVATGSARMLGLAERPARRELHAIGEAWRPWRSAAARLMWHYYANAPF
jgi:DNA-3-methyladenine glycosylase II